MVDLTGIATLILVFVTGYYAWQAHNQSSIMTHLRQIQTKNASDKAHGF
jgi:hypothetical protein